MIDPIQAMPTFTFSMEIKEASDAGITSLRKIWNLLAPMERSRRILFLSVATNAASMCMIATISPTMTVINRMALLPVPNQMMISGPSAIFGRAFRTTM